MIGGNRVVFNLPPRYRKTEVVFLKELLEAGRYRAVIDRIQPLEDVVEATKDVETEQKTGNVVLGPGCRSTPLTATSTLPATSAPGHSPTLVLDSRPVFRSR